MQCPSCSEKTIEFLDWCKTRNALWWKCPHCSTRLKASGSTWSMLGLALLLFIAILLGVAVARKERILSKDQGGTVLDLVPFLVLMPFYWFAYKRGGYVARGS